MRLGVNLRNRINYDFTVFSNDLYGIDSEIEKAISLLDPEKKYKYSIKDVDSNYNDTYIGFAADKSRNITSNVSVVFYER